MQGWLNTNIKPIAPNEAQETVRALRRCLRKARELRVRGDAKGAKRVRALADEKLVSIAKMLEGRFGRYAKGAFGNKLPHMVEEARGEMFTRLCSELMDLEPRAELYERRFNYCVERRVMIGAVRSVRSQHDMPSQGEIRKWDYVPESIQRSEEEAATAVDEEIHPIQPADPEAMVAFERVVGKRLAEELLARLDDKHRNVVVLRTMRGLAWEEVGTRVGVNWRTAIRYHERALGTLKRIFDEQS